MKSSTTIILVAITLFLAMTGKTARAQYQQLTYDQAKNILQPYLQDPDTSFKAYYSVSTNTDGHMEFVLHGNAGGKYTIDAATGVKDLSFAGFTGGVILPGNHLPLQQLRSAATSYVANHFPNYANSGLSVYLDTEAIEYELNSYSLLFEAKAPSGALLPNSCRVFLEATSGKPQHYYEIPIQAAIPATPAITADQAVAIGRDWILNNDSDYSGLLDLDFTVRGEPGYSLLVNVDSELNQALVYEVNYRAYCLIIDAQVGTVIGMDPYQGVGIGKNKKARLSALDREILWTVRTAKKGADSYSLPLTHSAIFTKGQTYIWQKHLLPIGMQTRVGKDTVYLKNRESELLLSLKGIATSSNRVAWIRGGEVYIPLNAILSLTDKVVKDAGQRQIIIQR